MRNHLLFSLLAFTLFATHAHAVQPAGDHLTVTTTPTAVGTSIGRKSLCITNTHATVDFFCGKAGDATKDKTMKAAGGFYCWSTCDANAGNCNAEAVIKCETASGMSTGDYQEAR